MPEFYAPLKIVTGDGCAETLGEEAAAFGAKRALIVTDKILAEQTEAVKRARASLESAGLTVELFADVEPDPLCHGVQRDGSNSEVCRGRGRPGGADREPLGREAAHRASLAVHRLVADLALPQCLADVSIDREAIPALAEEAFGNQRLLKNNLRGATAKDLAGILERVAIGTPC